LDPSGLEEQGWNRYSYVLNNPLNAFDPLGLAATPLNGSSLSASGDARVAVLIPRFSPTTLVAAGGAIAIYIGAVATGDLTFERLRAGLERNRRQSTILQSRGHQADGDRDLDLSKVEGQLGVRGWTEQEVRDAASGEPIGTSTDNTRDENGVRREEPATVYGTPDRHIIVNDQSGRVIQVSDRTDPKFKPDVRIRWND
jgi:uncharacterized protein RhaS with RHS repeats